MPPEQCGFIPGFFLPVRDRKIGQKKSLFYHFYCTQSDSHKSITFLGVASLVVLVESLGYLVRHCHCRLRQPPFHPWPPSQHSTCRSISWYEHRSCWTGWGLPLGSLSPSCLWLDWPVLCSWPRPLWPATRPSWVWRGTRCGCCHTWDSIPYLTKKFA